MPNQTLADFQKADLTDDHLAGDLDPIRSGALRAEYANTETISATKELVDGDCQFQILTADASNQTVELPAEATTNHVHVIKNPSGATYDLVVKDDSGTTTYCTLDAGEWAVCIPDGTTWNVLYSNDVNKQAATQYVLDVSVASNNITIAIKNKDGDDPSASKPVVIQIGDTLRSITSALSITINAGTNWFNSGGSELATQLVPYFVYAVWDSNSSAVALSIARKSHYRIVASGMTTNTSENHIYGYSGFTDGDDMANIGYFEATLSAGAGYTWTVPTFTNDNLHHEPTFISNWMSWTPAISTAGSLTYTSVSFSISKYRVAGKKIDYVLKMTGTLGGSAAAVIYATLPFEVNASANTPTVGFGNTAGVAAAIYCTGGTPDKISVQKYDASNYATTGSCPISVNGFYEPE